jgi:hypothetical protein
VIASEPSGDSPIPVDTMALADRVRSVVSVLLNTWTVSVRLKSEIMHKLSSEYYILYFKELGASPLLECKHIRFHCYGLIGKQIVL